MEIHDSSFEAHAEDSPLGNTLKGNYGEASVIPMDRGGGGWDESVRQLRRRGPAEGAHFEVHSAGNS